MTDLSNLTHCDKKILHLAPEGRANKSIAAEFWVAEKTGKLHLNDIHTRIGVRTYAMSSIPAM